MGTALSCMFLFKQFPGRHWLKRSCSEKSTKNGSKIWIKRQKVMCPAWIKSLNISVNFFFSNTWRKCKKKTATGNFECISIWPPVPTTWSKIQLQNCPITLLIWMQIPSFSGKGGSFSQPGYFCDDVTSAWNVGAVTLNLSSPKWELA